MTLKKVKIGLVSILIMLLAITGCNNQGADATSDSESIISEKFEMTSMEVSYIGDSISKYNYDESQNSILVSDTGITSKIFNNESLASVGTVQGKSENEDNPLVFEQGIFYQFKTNFITSEPYPNGLRFDFSLINEDNNVSDDIDSKTFAYGYADDLNETGEHTLVVEMKIPVDIKVGNYLLVMKALDVDLEEMVDKGESIVDIPEIGALYVTIEESSISNKIILVDSSIETYIDLSSEATFSEGYTNQQVGDAAVHISNESNRSYELEISGVLELEGGQRISLGLLDSSDGQIKEIAPYVINESNQMEANIQEASISYYIPESAYDSLIGSLPDLSVDVDSDGLKGVVTWTVHTKNQEILINDISNDVLLSKFEQNYSYEDSEEAITLSKSSNTISSKSYGQTFVNKGVLFSYGSSVNMRKGDKKKIALDFSTNYELEGLWSVPGVIADVGSSVNFYILNKKFTLLGLQAKAALSSLQRHPRLNSTGRNATEKASEGAKIVVTIFNVDFYRQNSLSDSTIAGTLSSDSNSASNKAVIDDTKERSKKKKSFEMPSYEWSEKKRFFTQRFMAGPVPIKISAGIEGSFEVITGASLEGLGILVTGTTPMSVKAFLEGGVSVALAEAGIKGEFILTETAGNASLRVGLNLNSNNRLSFQIKGKADLTLKLIRGAFAVYADTKTKVKWCKKKIIFKKITYPCGLTWDRNDFYFYKTPWLYQRKWTILNKTVPVYNLPYGF